MLWWRARVIYCFPRLFTVYLFTWKQFYWKFLVPLKPQCTPAFLNFIVTRKKAAYRPLFPRPCGQLVVLRTVTKVFPLITKQGLPFGHQGLPFGHQGLPFGLHGRPFGHLHRSSLPSPRSSLWPPRSSLWSPRSSLPLITKALPLVTKNQGPPFDHQGL